MTCRVSLSSLNPAHFVVKFTYVKITDNRNILPCEMDSHFRAFQRYIPQEGHSCEENTKTAAFPLAGIPSAYTLLYAEHDQENIDR